MNRDALLLYLRDLRDLEMAKTKTERLIEKAGNRVNEYHWKANKTYYRGKAVFDTGSLVFSLVAGVIMAVLFSSLTDPIQAVCAQANMVCGL